MRTDKKKNISNVIMADTKNLGGRPLKFKSVEELQTKIDAYFKSCWDYKRDMFGNRVRDKEGSKEKGDLKEYEYVMEQVRPYTVSGLADYLDTSRETLTDYEDKAEFSDTIKKAKDRIYAFTEESLFTSRVSGAIFSLKNNYNWKDKSELDQKNSGEIIFKVKT